MSNDKYELFSSNFSIQQLKQQSPPSHLKRQSLPSTHKGNISQDCEFKPSGRDRRQHWLWVIYMHALLHLYWCQKKILASTRSTSPVSFLAKHSELCPIVFTVSSLFPVFYQISLHQSPPPNLLFTSILFSSLLCSIDFELGWSTALYWKVHAVSSGNAIYLLPVWVWKNLIT